MTREELYEEYKNDNATDEAIEFKIKEQLMMNIKEKLYDFCKNVWVKVDGEMTMFNQDELHTLKEFIVEQVKINKRVEELIKYLTSGESIEEIQHCERIEDNKDLDKKTMIEMTRRYLIIHDKLLNIIGDEDE